MSVTKKLQYIKVWITECSAMEYADTLVNREKVGDHYIEILNVSNGSAASALTKKKVDYLEYMRITYGSKGAETLKAYIENSRISKLKNYAEITNQYAGWLKNGSLFVLNKEEKYISFLFNIKKESSSLTAIPWSVSLETHYNPLNVDCISEIVLHKDLFSDPQYIISTDEQDLIKQCDDLIQKKN